VVESLRHYKILDRIGSVDDGEAYRARDLRHGRTVAIKVLSAARAADPAARSRFLSEAQAATILSHPNIATVYEAGEENGVVFVALEFVPGETLKNVVAGRPLNPRRAADFAAQLADALAEAHAHGFSHGALHAESVMITPKGNAKIPGFVVGPAPDPAGVAGELPDPGDIVQLGALLFEMLTGKPVTLPGTRPPVPAAFEPVIAKALHAEPNERYQSAASFAAAVREAAGAWSPPAAASAPAPGRKIPVPARKTKGRRATGWLVTIVVLVVLAALVWLASGAGR
jgi:hypothetical protein